MQSIKRVMIPLLATSLASIAYARPPMRLAAQSLNALTVSGSVESALQQDEQKPKETPDAKPPKKNKQEKPAKQTKTEESPKQTDNDQKQNRDQAKQGDKQDKSQAGKGGRIPDNDFKAHFGQEHKFSVRQVVTTTTIVPNQTRFVYTGYTFVFVDPWPAEWAMGDDCYIDYVDGGYFLFDEVHPGVRIALTIVA